MSKVKTRKIVAKRFKITKKGNVRRLASQTSHLNRKDSKNASYRKKRDVPVLGKFAKKIKKMIH